MSGVDEPDADLRVSRRGDTIVLLLHEREVQVLGWVFSDLARLLGDEADSDAVTQRLFPHAYLDPTEEAAESQWQSVVHGDLVEARLGALRAVAEGLEDAPPVPGREGMHEVVLDEAGAEQWLGVVNDARLALGTALGVTAETDTDSLEPDDPRFDGLLVYDWLTHLLASLLHGAAGDLDAPTDEWGPDEWGPGEWDDDESGGDGGDDGGPEGGAGR